MFRIVALVLTVGLAGSAFGQRGIDRIRPAPPLIAALLPCIEDEGLGKELKLKPEQVKKLVDLRAKQWAEGAPPQAVGRGRAGQEIAAQQRAAFEEAFKTILDADQHKRAIQLAAQYVWATGRTPGAFVVSSREPLTAMLVADPNRVPSAALSRYPELADPLKPTDSQKELYAGRNSLLSSTTVFLTADQATAAKQLLGKPANLNWNEVVDPRAQRLLSAASFTPPSLFALTESDDVRRELGLRAAQVRVLDRLSDKWRTGTRPSPFGQPRGGFPPPGVTDEATLRKEMMETLDTLLTLAQRERLRQIERQKSSGLYGGLGSIDPPLTRKIGILEVTTALALSGKQVTDIDSAGKAHDAAFAKAVASDTPLTDILKAVVTARAAREKAIEAVLTPAQRTTLDQLLGKTFIGSTLPTARGTSATLAAMYERRRSESFGTRSAVELELLATDSGIQTELGLKPDQVKKAAAALKELNEKSKAPIRPRPDPAEAARRRTEQTALVAKAVGDVLTAAQGKRFRQLMLQRAEFFHERAGDSKQATTISAVGYPGVAEELRLAEDQKGRLIDGDRVAAVLTAEQRKTLTGLLGEPYTGDWIRPFTTFHQVGLLPSVASVLFDVPWDTFQLTPKQVEKLAALLNSCQRDATPVFVRSLPGEPFPELPDTAALARAADEKFATVIATLLTPEQKARVDQVRFRALAARSVAAFFTSPEVVQALRVTDAQSATIITVLDHCQRLRRETVQSFGLGAASRVWNPELAESELARVTAVLTPDQRAELKKRRGDPVPNLYVRPRGSYGFPSG